VAVEQRPQGFQFDLSGGHLALDFANTVSRRDSPEKTVEHLNSYHDLVSFARQTGTVTPQHANMLERKARAQPRAAVQVLCTAIRLREALFAVFTAVAEGEPCVSADLELINRAAVEALGHRHIVRANGSYEWRWNQDPTLERVTWPIAQAAAELLTSPERTKVRECQASDCYWLFLDHSRNRSRRWCSMDACGNREKARRHYHRQRAR